jgi:hypothetical protein
MRRNTFGAVVASDLVEVSEDSPVMVANHPHLPRKGTTLRAVAGSSRSCYIMYRSSSRGCLKGPCMPRGLSGVWAFGRLGGSGGLLLRAQLKIPGPAASTRGPRAGWGTTSRPRPHANSCDASSMTL